VRSYYPFAVLALIIISRSSAFAAIALSWTIIMAWGLSFLILLICAFLLRRAAEIARFEAKEKITDEILRAKGSSYDHHAAQLQLLLRRVNTMQEGAFSPITQQPPVRAVLLPLVSVGLTTLTEFGLIPGL
jgi:hypothetical protein